MEKTSLRTAVRCLWLDHMCVVSSAVSESIIECPVSVSRVPLFVDAACWDLRIDRRVTRVVVARVAYVLRYLHRTHNIVALVPLAPGD